MKKINIGNSILTIIALGLLCYLALAYVAHHDLGLVYNSDIITVPYLYQNLFLHGGKLSQWYFATTMGFFPDALVYFTLAAVIGNAKLALSFFAVYQLLLYFIVIIYLGYSLTKQHHGSIYVFCLSVLLLLLLYDSGYLQQNIFYGVAISGHFGTACMFLVGIILINNTMTTTGRLRHLNYWLLGLLCLLTVYSDLLFITQFVATAVAALTVLGILTEKHKRKPLQIDCTIIIGSTIFSYLLFRLSKPLFNLHFETYKHFLQRYTPHELALATQALFQKLQVFYQYNAIILILLSMFFAVSLVYGISLIIKRVKGEFLQDGDKPFVFTICMLFTAILTGYCSEIFLDNVIMASDPSLRSMQPFILFPVFLGIPLYLAYKTNIGELVKQYYKSIILALIFCTLVFVPMKPIMPLTQYYPAQTQCLDHYAKQYHLKNGIAQYWNAKINDFLSKQGINIVAVLQFKHPNNVVIKPYLYFDSQGSYIGKEFTFAFIDKNNNSSGVTTKGIEEAYGKPTKILDCEPTFHSPTVIYIYPKDVIGKGWKIKPNTR